MSSTAYLFEARSVQRFIFEGGKLRDMVSASDQLDILCNTPLDKILAVCGVVNGNDVRFCRRAGGAIYALFDSEPVAKQFQALWSCYIRQNFPSVELVQVVETAETDLLAMHNALARLPEQRNHCLPQLPLPGPLVRRSPRTGGPSVTFDHSAKEWVDEAIRLKRAHHAKNSSLLSKFAPDIEQTRWPVSLEAGEDAFPFIGDDRTVALIHADGNGVGEVLLTLSEVARSVAKGDDSRYSELFYVFSQALEKATRLAAQQATGVLLDAVGEENMLPARPLVLGGDDLTILVRADLAVPFTKAFCLAFEESTEQELRQVADLINQYGYEGDVTRISKMTACAGIALIKASQPFLQAHELAESLCREAKNRSRATKVSDNRLIASSIALHQVTGALIEEVADVREHEWRIQDGERTLELSLAAYGVGNEAEAMPALQNLVNLAEQFGPDGLNRSGLRQVAMLVREDLHKAEQRYQRWRQISRKNARDRLRKFDDLLSGMCCLDSIEKLPFDKSTGLSPLIDLLVITGIAQGEVDA